MKEQKRFKYKARNREQVRKRATQSGGMFDALFKDQFEGLRVKEGSYRLRILPPTWPKPDHYGIDVYVHYRIGADKQSYLCLEKNADWLEDKDQACPICEERRQLEKAGETEAMKALTATKRVLVWVIDRKAEEEGPKLWPMPWTIDRDFAALSEDKESGELLCIDDPEQGYDVSFTREGADERTKYVGKKIARRPTPLAADEEDAEKWLAYATEHPLPSVLHFYEADYIAGVFAGASAAEEEDEDKDDEPPKKSKRKPAPEDEEPEDEEEPPKKSKRKPAPEDEEEDEEPEDEDEEPEDEDEEEPPKKSKRKPAPEDEEEDEEPEDEDEDEDEPPKKSKRVKRARSVSEEDED